MKFDVIAHYDVVVMGSGISGLICALELAKKGKSVFIATKEAVTESSSLYAQGGIAVPLKEGDSISKHLEDTLKVGANLCDKDVATEIINSSHDALKKLMAYGVRFDLDKTGSIHQTKEAAHSFSRVCHVGGDATGRFVVKSLIDLACREPRISISQGTSVLSIVNEENIFALLLEDVAKNNYVISAKDLIIASGGVGQLYKITSNPLVCTGDGIALAFRIGAKLMDMEMMQFHPTVCTEKGDPFLITEAIRGEGGKLRNINGEYFACKYHELGELAPRDVLARAIYKEMEKTKSKFVYLDLSNFDANYFGNRFPTVFKECVERKINLFSEGIPVSPAAHYYIGGIKTDLYCRTSISSLWAIGECSCNGFHGANRLASNSLLECIVTPHFLVQSILAESSCSSRKADFVEIGVDDCEYDDKTVLSTKAELQRNNLLYLGLIRNGVSLKEHIAWLEDLMNPYNVFCYSQSAHTMELRNMILLSYLIAKAAYARNYSIGVHYREDSYVDKSMVINHSYLDVKNIKNTLLNSNLDLRSPIFLK